MALALSLAACGRRGALEPPPDPAAPKEQQATGDADALTAAPVPGQGKKRPKAITPPDRPFILDPLL